VLEVSHHLRRSTEVKSRIAAVPKFQAAIRDRAGVVPRLLPAVAVAWPMPLLQLCKRERRRSAEVMTKMTTTIGERGLRWIRPAYYKCGHDGVSLLSTKVHCFYLFG
jgi:hypothetical protein